jgi:hypothetical protein
MMCAAHGFLSNSDDSGAVTGLVFPAFECQATGLVIVFQQSRFAARWAAFLWPKKTAVLQREKSGGFKKTMAIT